MLTRIIAPNGVIGVIADESGLETLRRHGAELETLPDGTLTACKNVPYPGPNWIPVYLTCAWSPEEAIA